MYEYSKYSGRLSDFSSCSKQGQLAHLKGPLGVQLAVLGGQPSGSFGLVSRANLDSSREETRVSSVTAPVSQALGVLKMGWISM